MMAQKHLHELLKEDQEPFMLKNYISDRRSQIKRATLNTSLQVKKRKSIHQNTNFPGNFCKNACLFSFPETPDLRKSPLFEFASPANKSPCKSPNTIFLNIPSRTATLLLEAALRIQKQSPSSKLKPVNKNNGFGLFGSLFKRLKQRNQNRKREIEGEGVKVSVKDTLTWDSSIGRKKISNGSRKEQERMDSHNGNNIAVVNAYEVEFPCSCNGRTSSAVWSESNEEKSLDTETSISSRSDNYSEEFECVAKQKDQTECACCCDNGFCQSPFRFVLERSPSAGRQTPELASPVRSPSPHITEDKESNGAERLNKFQSGEEEEEDKEQCSPVSVLDTPFEDEDEVQENDDGEDGFDLDCSYAIMQRAKQQLLYKLSRFEKLAELDPVELEKRMLDQDDDEDETCNETEDCEDGDSRASYKENDFKETVFEVLCQTSLLDKQKVPEDLKRLVSDLIMEEERELNYSEDRDMAIRKVCKRLELWKEVKCNTIDMMIEHDLSREHSGWKKDVEQIKELAGELELAVFGFLMEEFSEELVANVDKF